MSTKQIRVNERTDGRTELTVNHNNQDLTFIYPSFGPNTYANVQNEIEQAKLKTSTMSQTASLVDSAFNSKDRYSQEIQKLLKEKWLWTFTGILYVPKEGAYIQDDPEVKKGMPFMEKSGLVKLLEANDPSVRFVPFGFKTGEMSSSKLAKNKFAIGLAGEEGAEKLAETASKFKDQPYLYGFESVEEAVTRVSALYSGWYSDHGLDVYGDYYGYDRNCHAFGYAPQNFSTGNKAE